MATAPQRFSEFLVFLESVLTDEMRGIMPLVIKRYDACSRPFKNSNDMLTLLTTTKTDMQRDQRHMFIYLKDFLSELAAYQEREKMAAVKRKRDSDLSDEDDISGGESEKPDSKKGKTNPQPIPGAKESPGCGDGVLPNSCLSSSSAVKPVEHNGWIGGEGGGHSSETGSTHLQKGQDGLTSESTRGEVKDEDVDHKKKTRSSEPSGSVPQQKEVSEKHIRKLEKLLGKLRNEIEKVREKELSLDDLDAEDSSYIYEDRLEKKFVAVWNKLCLAKKRKTSTGRPTERRFTYRGSRYPEVNKRIERLINRKKMFPDYFDIRKIFCKVNEEQSLNLSTGAIASLSKEAFIDVGNILQKRRHEDFICTFKSKQTESFRIDKDPALHDKELKRKLEENRQKGKNKLAEVINKYADLQYNIPEKEESSDEDVSQESAIDVDDFDLDELSDEEVSIDKKGSTYSHSKPDKPERRRVVLTYLSISDDEVSTEKEGKQAAKCKETKQCLSLSHSDVSVENEKGPIASDNLPDEFKPREVTCPESERYLCLSDDDTTAEKEDQVTCKKPKQYLTPSGEFKPREVTCPESEMYLCLSDEDITAEKEDQVTCKKPKQYQTPSGEIKPREVTCPESERYLCLSDEDSEKGDQVTCKKPKPYLTVSWEIKRREVVCVESKTYLSVSDEEDCADKSDLSSVTPAKVDSVETEVEEIQPRSTDRNIWPEPKRVTLVVKAFNERKDEPSVNSENVKKFNADSVSNKIKVVDINEESCTTGDNETSGSAIPSCNKVLVLDLTDDESYIYETSERKSRYENQVCKNKDTIEEIPGKDKDAGLQATLDSKISENHIGEMFEDELPDVEVIDDGSDINVKPSVSTETSNENSINNKDVDTGTADKEPIVEIDDEDEDDDDISEISKEKSVTDNKLDEEEESVVEITDDITDTQAIKILSDERPVDRICGRSNTKADIANTLKADSAACEKPVSPTTASSDSCKDTSPSSSSPSSISRIVTLMDKKIQLHIPKCLLKKTNNKGTAQVKSHFQVSTLKCEQRLNSGLVSMETSTDSTEVNIVSSSNIPADNDVILVSSGNFEAIDDDEIIILSD